MRIVLAAPDLVRGAESIKVAQTRKQNRETKRETRSKSDKNDLLRDTTCAENVATCLFLSLAPRVRAANDATKVINLMNWLQGVGARGGGAPTKKSPAIHHLLNHGLALYSNTRTHQRETQTSFCEFACECGLRIFSPNSAPPDNGAIRRTERQAAGETMGLWNDNDGWNNEKFSTAHAGSIFFSVAKWRCITLINTLMN